MQKVIVLSSWKLKLTKLLITIKNLCKCHSTIIILFPVFSVHKSHIIVPMCNDITTRVETGAAAVNVAEAKAGRECLAVLHVYGRVTGLYLCSVSTVDLSTLRWPRRFSDFVNIIQA